MKRDPDVYAPFFAIKGYTIPGVLTTDETSDERSEPMPDAHLEIRINGGIGERAGEQC
jgi:hypothetical protein